MKDRKEKTGKERQERKDRKGETGKERQEIWRWKSERVEQNHYVRLQL